MVRGTLKKWWAKFKQSPASKESTKAELYSGASGQPPSRIFLLASLSADIKASSTGPDTGIRDMLPCVPGLQIGFDRSTPWAYGRSLSLYDAAPSGSGARAGDPIADCFAVVSYENHTLLAVADGVNWGEPAKRAARSAVLGAVAHLHNELPTVNDGNPAPSTDQVFTQMVKALEPAQKLILAQFGTLTTLVLTVVARLALPIKWSTLKTGSEDSKRCYHWAAMTVTVGDSSAFVYRALDGTVEELTYPAHAGSYRDPRWTPGALGYALGEEPDLSNMCCTLTLLNKGDLVFLTSDGVADNFDPFILKLGRQACNPVQWSIEESQEEDDIGAHGSGSLNQPPVMDSEESYAKQVQLLTEAVRGLAQRSGAGAGVAALASGSGSGDVPQGREPCPRDASPEAAGPSPRSGKAVALGSKDLTAQDLVDGLLEHVLEVTHEARHFAEAKQASLDAKRRKQAEQPPDLPSLSTDARTEMLTIPPGKMDHATVAAYVVGGQQL